MPEYKDIDQDLFGKIKARATQLKGDHSDRDVDFAKYEDMFLMRWDDKRLAKINAKAKPTRSPNARNVVVGAVRLMVATDPVFRIDKQDDSNASATEDLQATIRRMWSMSGHLAGCPIHYDAIMSALLYSEMHTDVESTEDILKIAREAEGKDKSNYAKARIKRAEFINNRTPFVFISSNPKNGYPDFNRYGMLDAFYRCTQSTVGALIDEFGEAVPESMRQTANRYNPVNLHLFYDTVYKCVWVDGGCISLEEHGLSLIPVAVQLVDGSRLFNKKSEQRQPILYTLAKSGIWERENMALSVIYTMVFGLGVNPMFKHRQPPGQVAGQPGKELVIDFDRVGGVVELEPGEDFEAVHDKGLIDPAMMEALALAERLDEESTIYKVSLGSPAGVGAAAFSSLNLISQSGRLPLTGTQKRGGFGIGGIIELALTMAKDAGLNYKKNGMEIVASKIPDTVLLDTQLEVKLPQDKLQLANIMQILGGGANPFLSHSWLNSNVMGIQDPEHELKAIMKEGYQKQRAMQRLQQELTELQQAWQTQQKAASGGGGGNMPPNMLANMPPSPDQTGNSNQPPPQDLTAGPMMPPGQAEQIQGMPPQAAGMVPGMGQNVVPPDQTGGA